MRTFPFMRRYDLNSYDDDDNGPPWWAKALACVAVALVAAVWHRLQTGQW